MRFCHALSNTKSETFKNPTTLWANLHRMNMFKYCLLDLKNSPFFCAQEKYQVQGSSSIRQKFHRLCAPLEVFGFSSPQLSLSHEYHNTEIFQSNTCFSRLPVVVFKQKISPEKNSIFFWILAFQTVDEHKLLHTCFQIILNRMRLRKKSL